MNKPAFMLLILELMKLSNSQSQSSRFAILHRTSALILDGRVILVIILADT